MREASIQFNMEPLKTIYCVEWVPDVFHFITVAFFGQDLSFLQSFLGLHISFLQPSLHPK